MLCSASHLELLRLPSLLRLRLSWPLLCAAVVETTAQIHAVIIVHVPVHRLCAVFEFVARALGSAATSAAVLVKVVSALSRIHTSQANK